MSLPLIGVSGSRNIPERQMFVRENYLESVLRAGGMPVLLPQALEPALVEAYLDRLDGLLLAGGVDIDPSYYGEALLPECGEIDPKRDEFEMLITKAALKRRMPIFGICRGIQSLAVAMDCTLYQDIESQCHMPKITHQQEPPYNAPTHEVRFEKGGLLEQIVGAESMMVNSMHHQAVKRCSDQLIIEGYSDTGIIEAVRSADNDAVFAVQFHPEYLSAESEKAQNLFNYFIKKAREYAEQK